MFTNSIVSLILGIALFIAPDTADDLMLRYMNVRVSVANQRGLAPGDLEAITVLRDELSEWTATHDDVRVISAELQLSLWLNDVDGCNSLFGRLTDLKPENANIGLAWANFQLSQDGADANEVYEALFEKYPDNPDIVLNWARFLEGNNQFTAGIRALEKLDEETLSKPNIASLYASLYYANNRFEEAVAAIDVVDQTDTTLNPVALNKLNNDKKKYEDIAKRWEEETNLRDVEAAADDLPRATILSAKGPIVVELFEDHAPNTVANFVSLAESGFYDGVRFHRVLPKFMAQGGDPNSREGAAGAAGSGGPGYTIKDEHTGEEIRKHFAGTLSMAKTSEPNSGGSQFFLTHLPTPHLDGRHTVFGRIMSGLEIARSLEPNDDIFSITITRKRAHDYTPEKIGEKVAKTPNPSKNPKTPVKNPGLTTSSQGN